MPSPYRSAGMRGCKRGLMLQPMKSFDFIAAITHEDSEMFRRITLLIPLLALLTLSGCIVFPHGGWHGDHHYDRGGPGYYQPR